MSARPRRPAGSRLVRIFARIVPARSRDRFVSEWEGELAAADREDRPGRRRAAAGSLRDALWLMAQSWRADTLRQDLRFAARSWLRRPGTAATIVALLAAGIGVTVAMFGVVDTVLLQPLPFPQPDRLVRLYMAADERGVLYANLNPLDLRDIEVEAASLEGVGYMTSSSVTLTGVDEPVRLSVGFVSANYFGVVGVAPARGRAFLPGEDDPGNANVAILAHHTWRDRFGADPGVLGRELVLNGVTHRVVGVLPPAYDDPLSAVAYDFWLPLEIDAETQGRGGHFVRALGRMAPHASVAGTSEEVAAIFERIVEIYDKRGPGRRMWATSLHDTLVRDIRPMVVLLALAVGLVLLIACANVAGLMIAAGVERGRELALRRALGAGRGRLVRQLVSESLLLSLVGGTLGAALAGGLLAAAPVWLPADLPRLDAVALDARALGFAALTLLGTTLLFGTLPALVMARGGAGSALRAGSASHTGGPLQSRLRALLVVGEIALTVTLLAAFALTLASVRNLMNSDYGFEAEGRLAASISLPSSAYAEPGDVAATHAEIARRLATLPTVTATGAVNRLPLSDSYSCDGFSIEGAVSDEPGSACVEERTVVGDYFEAMGIEVLAGRTFDSGDDAAAPAVVVVTRAFVDRWLDGIDGERAIGRRFLWGHPSYYETDDGSEPDLPWRTIVGVVEDVHHFGAEQSAEPEVYMPHAQVPSARRFAHVVRTEGRDPQALLPAIRGVVSDIDPALPVFDVTTMSVAVRARTADRRAAGTLFGGFAALGALLSAVGIYGVLAATVSARRREFGVRLALGATPADVTRLVARRAAALTLLGAAIGLALAQATSRWLSSLLFGVGTGDPAVIIAVTAAMLLLAAVAAFVPARRAARVDSMVALRDG